MPAPKWKAKKITQLQKHFKEVLTLLGYNVKDPNFKGTPGRVAKLWFDELYRRPPTKKIYSVFPTELKQMVVLKDHVGWTRCPHHFERVKLLTSIAYIPKAKFIGLSKLARIADFYAHGLVLQEDYTEQLANGLFEALKPLGVAVYIIGEHLCVQARGVRSPVAKTITTALRGEFLDQGSAREEFLLLVREAK